MQITSETPSDSAPASTLIPFTEDPEIPPGEVDDTLIDQLDEDELVEPEVAQPAQPINQPLWKDDQDVPEGEKVEVHLAREIFVMGEGWTADQERGIRDGVALGHGRWSEGITRQVTGIFVPAQAKKGVLPVDTTQPAPKTSLQQEHLYRNYGVNHATGLGPPDALGRPKLRDQYFCNKIRRGKLWQANYKWQHGPAHPGSDTVDGANGAVKREEQDAVESKPRKERTNTPIKRITSSGKNKPTHEHVPRKSPAKNANLSPPSAGKRKGEELTRNEEGRRTGNWGEGSSRGTLKYAKKELIDLTEDNDDE